MSGTRLDPRAIPRHVAIIMDGNGRWAEARGRSRIEGHREGLESVRAVVRAAHELGVRVLTLYAFSLENWNRPKLEVDELMRLLDRYIESELDEVNRNGIRVRAIGRLERLPAAVQDKLRHAQERTRSNREMDLVFAVSYGGRAEIVDAARRAIREGIAADALDEATFGSLLYTAGQPDPDLLIRTSGEMRVSNFLLWQIAYAEIWVTDALWPDFRARHLLEAVSDYQKRDRRYGAVPSPVGAGQS